MVQICALASGSNGNCYYVGNQQEAVLVDIGISNRQLTKRLREVGLSAAKIKAVFISHEHTDHVRGLRSITDRNNIQAFITEQTFEKTRKDYRAEKVNYFVAGDTITAGNIKIHTFSKKHDAIDPVSFRIEIDNQNVAVLTDLGIACELVQEHLQLCNAAFLETNYEHDLLMQGKYPTFLKHRVASEKGHLSNRQAVDLVKSLHNSPLKTLVLSHISADNNQTALAIKAFAPIAQNYHIETTSRYAASKLINLTQ